MSIETKPCDNAEDLIQELDIILPRWSYNNWNSEWIFRGQAETEQPLPLVSAALRSEEHASEQMGIARLTSKKWNKWRTVEEVLGNSQINLSFDGERIIDLIIQVFAEVYILRDFFELGESLNLSNSFPMQSDFPNLNDSLAKEYIENIENDHFMLKVWGQPHIAVAQHHGLATRLLDWTKNPLYAAYFACEGMQDKTTHIAVYAMNSDFLKHDIRLIEISNKHSNYIHAQEGVFTLDTKADLEFLKTGEWRSIEDVSKSTIYRFTLPKDKINELVRILWLKRVTKAHMMPSLDNVIMALKSKWKLQLEDHQKLRE